MTQWESIVTQQTLKQSFPNQLGFPWQVKFQAAGSIFLKPATEITMKSQNIYQRRVYQFSLTASAPPL